MWRRVAEPPCVVAAVDHDRRAGDGRGRGRRQERDQGGRLLGWDESAALIDPAGRKILIQEALGDGKFTIYTTGTPSGAHDILVENGEVVLVLDAGQ